MRPTSLAAGATVVVVLSLLSACDATERGLTTDVDDQRLSALASEPLLSGGDAIVGGDPNTSANYTFRRGSVSVGYGPWGASGGHDEESWVSASTMLTDVRAGGWTVTGVECTVDDQSGFEGASLVALKDLGGFTAALEAEVDSGGSRVSGLVPYHDEPTNPWQPSDELEVGASCLELPEPPRSGSALGGNSNLDDLVLLSTP